MTFAYFSEDGRRGTGLRGSGPVVLVRGGLDRRERSSLRGKVVEDKREDVMIIDLSLIYRSYLSRYEISMY